MRHCPSALKSRVLAKFVESDHEKVDRLVELHLKYFAQVKKADSRIRALREVSHYGFVFTSASFVSCYCSLTQHIFNWSYIRMRRLQGL
ncbi:unnamed protein product [Echinostoma caproni]|uniref:Beta-catenin-like protein 1 N-terminal domain-containing protein n=1 Tax=Echinostoma caproni TaxID=27848 RepID=A0A3P8HN48_9TREM|nr:unnamed protein product [Echinostoma caproni]